MMTVHREIFKQIEEYTTSNSSSCAPNLTKKDVIRIYPHGYFSRGRPVDVSGKGLVGKYPTQEDKTSNQILLPRRLMTSVRRRRDSANEPPAAQRIRDSKNDPLGMKSNFTVT